MKPVSYLINPADIEITKNAKGKEEILGSGQFGVVKKAIWSTHTGQKVKISD